MNTTDQVSQVAGRVGTALVDGGFTVLKTSDETGIPRTTLIRRLSGVTPFTVAELAAIAALLGTTVSDLTRVEAA